MYRIHRLFLVLTILFQILWRSHASEKGDKELSTPYNDTTLVAKEQFRDPEVKEIRRKYWERTFREIRNLGSGLTKSSESSLSSSTTSSNILGQWTKRKTTRFEGLPSWDRLLQDWADDVQEYLDKVEAESEEGGYSFSNYGRSPSILLNITRSAEDHGHHNHGPMVSGGTSSSTTHEVLKKEPIPLPVPKPAVEGEEVLAHTDLRDDSKRVLIVTTAALPWRTGTAVNPLLRAAYLTRGRKEAGGSVTLMIPWLETPADQKKIYGDNAFETQEDQEKYIRTWLRESADMPDASEDLIISWYTARQNPAENSIYSMGDITAFIPPDSIDICILEEPEHLNWYRAPGESWTKKFKHVAGILHTNYFQYAMDQPAALIRAPAMRLLCSWMCRAHCHRVIKLSGTLDVVAPEKELVENVHGVRADFLNAGKQLCKTLSTQSGKESDPVFGASAEPSIYFIGKMLWSKGLGSLMELLRYAEESADLKVSVDMYGGGPDKEAAEKKAKALQLNMTFPGPVDHAELAFSHKIFVNPSTSEVLCTTSAEALAMGKFVILPSHPSNDFFEQFPNCLTYTSKEEFVGNLYYALTHAPEPLAPEYSHALSWEAATERLKAAACIPKGEAEMLDHASQSDNAAIEITLPPLLDDEESRRVLTETFHKTRSRYRTFRTNLSREVEQNKVLPRRVKERLLTELNKRLDLDFDEIFNSPKLRLKLSPAELDKSLLELYEKVSESGSGDVLRVIGGGGPVALQNLYMKRQAAKKSRKNLREGRSLDLFPTFDGEVLPEESIKSATQRVRLALQRNLPARATSEMTFFGVRSKRKHETSNSDSPVSTSSDKTPSMSFRGSHCHASRRQAAGSLGCWDGLRPPSSFHGTQLPRPQTFSTLI